MTADLSSIALSVRFHNHNFLILCSTNTTFRLCHISGSFLETRGTPTGKSPSFDHLVFLCRLRSWTNPESEGSLTVIFSVNFFTIFGGDPCAKNPHRYPPLRIFHLRKGNHRVIIKSPNKIINQLNSGNTFNK